MNSVKEELERAIPQIDAERADTADLISAGKRAVRQRRARIGGAVMTLSFVAAGVGVGALGVFADQGKQPVSGGQAVAQGPRSDGRHSTAEGDLVSAKLTLVALEKVADACEDISLDADTKTLTGQGRPVDASDEAEGRGWVAAEFGCGADVVRVLEVERAQGAGFVGRAVPGQQQRVPGPVGQGGGGDPGGGKPAVSRDAAFSEFVAARQGHLLRVAYALTGNRHDAEDLLQTALVKVYVAWPRLRRPEAAEAFVRTTSVRANIDESRRPWRRETCTDTVPDGSVEDAEPLANGLFTALQGLPPMQRKVIVLRHWLDLSVTQTAQELGISPGTVKTHSHRGLEALRAVRVLQDGPLGE